MKTLRPKQEKLLTGLEVVTKVGTAPHPLALRLSHCGAPAATFSAGGWVITCLDRNLSHSLAPFQDALKDGAHVSFDHM